jgi:hypothetical protein
MKMKNSYTDNINKALGEYSRKAFAYRDPKAGDNRKAKAYNWVRITLNTKLYTIAAALISACCLVAGFIFSENYFVCIYH